MKTILENNGQVVREVKRVSDGIAFHMVMTGKWSYCPKSVWKAAKAAGTTQVEIEE